jgi:hypothetical protein
LISENVWMDCAVGTRTVRQLVKCEKLIVTL